MFRCLFMLSLKQLWDACCGSVWFTELLYLCAACRLLWGHMTPGVGVLSSTVTLMLTHHRSALILACTHLLLSCTLRAAGCFSVMRGWRLSFWCACRRFKNTFLQRVAGSDQSCEILFVFTRVGGEMIRGFSSGWRARLLILLEVHRDADGGGGGQTSRRVCCSDWLITLFLSVLV